MVAAKVVGVDVNVVGGWQRSRATHRTGERSRNLQAVSKTITIFIVILCLFTLISRAIDLGLLSLLKHYSCFHCRLSEVRFSIADSSCTPFQVTLNGLPHSYSLFFLKILSICLLLGVLLECMNTIFYTSFEKRGHQTNDYLRFMHTVIPLWIASI